MKKTRPPPNGIIIMAGLDGHDSPDRGNKKAPVETGA
jgi:hypothetical protein